MKVSPWKELDFARGEIIAGILRGILPLPLSSVPWLEFGGCFLNTFFVRKRRDTTSSLYSDSCKVGVINLMYPELGVGSVSAGGRGVCLDLVSCVPIPKTHVRKFTLLSKWSWEGRAAIWLPRVSKLVSED